MSVTRTEITLDRLRDSALEEAQRDGVSMSDFLDLYVQVFVEYIWTLKAVERHHEDLRNIDRDIIALTGRQTEPAVFGTVSHFETERLRHEDAIQSLFVIRDALTRTSPKGAAGAKRFLARVGKIAWISIEGGTDSGHAVKPDPGALLGC